jgi:PhzF family phenazine biosynthesis protein
MKVEYFHVDAFADKLFSGNPAGVCLLDKWLPEQVMLNIAAENNLSETAFVIPTGDYFKIRWFTPQVEVELCGHATLASSHVLFNHKGFSRHILKFRSQTEELTVEKGKDLLYLNFPSRPPTPSPIHPELISAFNVRPLEILSNGRAYFLVFQEEKTVRDLQPDMSILSRLDQVGVIVTAPGNETDFVSRFFAPKEGIPEDPVTGSAHCTLIPYWAKRLSKTSMTAFQVSARGGRLWCEDMGDRVKIGGKAVTYLQGWIDV